MTMNFEKTQMWRELSNDAGNYYCQASDFERQHFKDWLVALLREQEATIDFIKADGEFRSMKCTLNEGRGAKYSSNGNKKRPNPDVCVVWDTNRGAWRSFRWDRIKRIQFDLG